LHQVRIVTQIPFVVQEIHTGVEEGLNGLLIVLYNLFKVVIERIGDLSVEEERAFINLRPTRLGEFVGQEAIKEKLEIYIAAAQGRNEPLDHVLLHSPPGLGKTTLAHIIATEMGVNARVSSGPALERAGDLAAVLTNLNPCDIFFIDEIRIVYIFPCDIL